MCATSSLGVAGLRPLRGPSGIACDLGGKVFDSTEPSPVKRGKPWALPVPAVLSSLASGLKVDPWVGHAKGEGPQPLRQPSSRTYARFKVTFDKFLKQVRDHPGSFRRDVDRRRDVFPIGLRGEADFLRDPYLVGSAFAVGLQARRSSKESRSKAPETRSSRPPPVNTDCIAEAAAAKVLAASDHLASPSMVMADERTGAERHTLPRESTLGLPPLGECASPLSPPARCGWTSAAGGHWQRHSDDLKWLFNLEAGVYFHIASHTAWREAGDACEALRPSSTRLLSKVRIEPANGEHLVLPLASLYESEEFLSEGHDSKLQNFLIVSLPGAGWQPLQHQSWRCHDGVPGWLYEPDENMFFHEPSETLWRPDSDQEECGEVQVRRVDGGARGLPGTPEGSSFVSRSSSMPPSCTGSRSLTSPEQEPRVSKIRASSKERIPQRRKS